MLAWTAFFTGELQSRCAHWTPLRLLQTPGLTAQGACRHVPVLHHGERQRRLRPVRGSRRLHPQLCSLLHMSWAGEDPQVRCPPKQCTSPTFLSIFFQPGQVPRCTGLAYQVTTLSKLSVLDVEVPPSATNTLPPPGACSVCQQLSACLAPLPPGTESPIVQASSHTMPAVGLHLRHASTIQDHLDPIGLT